MRQYVLCFGLLAALILGLSVTPAHAASFSDVPASHPASEAISYLQSQGIVEGYGDGSYRPEQLVNRAEALKFIIAPLITDEQLQAAQTSRYADISADDWYAPYVEIARVNGIVDGPPKATSFFGSRTVNHVEFLKMIELSHEVNPKSFDEIRLPLSSDVTNTDEWYYPYMRYALSASMVTIDENGLLVPGKQLTRADTAMILYNLIRYRQGEQTEVLINSTESEILIVFGTLDLNDIIQAEYASARALVMARGALASSPNDPSTKATLKIAEAFRALVGGYRAGLNLKYDEVVRLTGDAWHLAGKAMEFESSFAPLTEKVQGIATDMADLARARQ